MPEVPGQKGPRLVVEGVDDFHVIRELLARHGIARDQEPRCPRIGPAEPGRNKDALLDAVTTAIAASTGFPIGFVIDANASAHETWRRIAGRTREADVPTSKRIPKNGFIGFSDRYKAPVGVWVMPDNEHDGALEGFLEKSVPSDDVVFPYARRSAREAKRRGARFARKDEHKATLYTWLAWQKTPGGQYGMAMSAHFFDAHSEVAVGFLAWFRKLYQLTDSPQS